MKSILKGAAYDSSRLFATNCEENCKKKKDQQVNSRLSSIEID